MQRPPSDFCLRYPTDLGMHQFISLESAVKMLLSAVQLAAKQPFVWAALDRPADGQVALIFIPAQSTFPNDGVRWLEQGQVATSPAGGNMEIELIEDKCGFVPNSQERMADRLRRRYRMLRGGHHQLVLVHYTRDRTHAMPIPASIANVPVRQYPLRQVNEPAVFVVGSRTGERVPAGPPVVGGLGGAGGPVGGVQAQAQLLAQQNASMQALDARRDPARQAHPAPPPEDADSGDEGDYISTRTLATTRYKRNHELMNQVFMYAAYGDKTLPPQPAPYSKLFKQDELEETVAKLSTEIEELKAKAAVRKEARAAAAADMDVSMDMMADVQA